MVLPIEMLLVTSCVGALQSVFFGIYLFTQKKGRSVANLLLGVLLVVFAIRISKSVGYYFASGHIIPDWLMNFGFGTNLAILPLLWLYLNAFLRKEYRFTWQRDLLHLIPAIATLLLSPFLTGYFWLAQHGYILSLVVMMAYVPLCIILIAKYVANLSGIQKIWVVALTAGVTLVWLGYLLNFVFGLVPYITGPVLFSLLIYFMSFLGLRERSLFNQDGRYEKSKYSAEQIDKCFEDLREWLTKKQSFKDTSLTLPRLAGQLDVPANLLSETINNRARLNFPDFINSYRIREARALLENPEYHQEKIATIAFETGFKSLSVFNAAFKKFTSLTPSAYRKNLVKE